MISLVEPKTEPLDRVCGRSRLPLQSPLRIEICVNVVRVDLDGWFETISGEVLHTTTMPNYTYPSVESPFEHFYATATPDVPDLSLRLERIAIDPDTPDKGIVFHPAFFYSSDPDYNYKGPWYSSKHETSANKCANDPILQDQTVTFAVKMGDCTLDTLEITVRSGYNYLIEEKAEYKKGMDYVVSKYNPIVSPTNISLHYDPTLGDGAYTTLLNNAYLGPTRLEHSENWTAYTIGHENVHGGQSYYLRWLAGGPPGMSESLRLYWEAVMEIPAYQWGLDHAGAGGVCLTAGERSIVQGALDMFIQQMEDNEP